MSPMHRIDPSVAAVRRLRRHLFGASIALALAFAAVLVVGTLASGAPLATLVTPLVGASLALAAELLCLDVAIRRVQRLIAPVPAPGVDVARARAIGV